MWVLSSFISLDRGKETMMGGIMPLESVRVFRRCDRPILLKLGVSLCPQRSPQGFDIWEASKNWFDCLPPATLQNAPKLPLNPRQQMPKFCVGCVANQGRQNVPLEARPENFKSRGVNDFAQHHSAPSTSSD